MRASNSANGPGRLCMRGRHVVRDTYLAYSFLKLRGRSSTLLYVPLRCVTKGVIMVHTLMTKLSLLPIAPSKRPLGSLAGTPIFTTVVPVRICGSLRIPRRGAVLRRVERLVVKNNPVSSRLGTTLGSFPRTM